MIRSAFQTQGPQFDPRLIQGLNSFVRLSFSPNSAFHPSGVALQMSTSVCWELTCNGLVSRPGGVKDSHSLNTTKPEIRAGSMSHLALKGFSFRKLWMGNFLFIKRGLNSQNHSFKKIYFQGRGKFQNITRFFKKVKIYIFYTAYELQCRVLSDVMVYESQNKIKVTNRTCAAYSF